MPRLKTTNFDPNTGSGGLKQLPEPTFCVGCIGIEDKLAVMEKLRALYGQRDRRCSIVDALRGGGQSAKDSAEGFPWVKVFWYYSEGHRTINNIRITASGVGHGRIITSKEFLETEYATPNY